MSKWIKYIKDLEISLDNFGFSEKKLIIDKYNSIIDNKLEKKEKITNILKELGSPKEVALKEIEGYNKIEAKNEKIKVWKEKFSNFNKKISDKFKDVTKKTKKVFKHRKFKKEKTENKIKKVLSVKIGKRNSSSKTIYTFIEIILLIILFYISTLFSASLFALLDHVKIYGLALTLFFIVTLTLYLLYIINNAKNDYKYNRKTSFVVFISIFVCINLSVGLTIYNYLNIDYIKDVSEKYSMTFKTNEYKFPKKGKQLHLYFNSWYKPAYMIEYDNELVSRIKIDIKYYENFYDLNIKNESGNIYLSLTPDKRDLMSLYLNNLKENKIYNEKELSRYIVKIYINENDKNRLIIHD